jgi:hypothetical protein
MQVIPTVSVRPTKPLLTCLPCDRKYLNVDDISGEIEKLSRAIGHVFKGIIVRSGEYPQVLSVLTLESAREIEKLYGVAIEAINQEKKKNSG